MSRGAVGMRVGVEGVTIEIRRVREKKRGDANDGSGRTIAGQIDVHSVQAPSRPPLDD